MSIVDTGREYLHTATMTCKICSDKRIDRINGDIISGMLRSEVAKKYKLNYRTIQRHEAKCLGDWLAVALAVPTLQRKPKFQKVPKVLAPNREEGIPFEETVPEVAVKGGLRTYERMEGLIETLESLLASLGNEDEDFYKKTTVIEELRRVLETSIKIYEAQCKIAAMFSKAEDVSASMVFRWLGENHPEVLEGLREYIGRRLV